MLIRLFSLCLVALLLTFSPLAYAQSAEELAHSDHEMSEDTPLIDCQEITQTKKYVNSTSIPGSIFYNDGVFAGRLYEIKRVMGWGGWYVTFQGVVCRIPPME